MLAAACGVFGFSAILIVLPTMMLPRHLDQLWKLSGYEDGLVSTLFFAGNTAGLVFFGFIGDRYGRRPATLAGLCIMLVGCLLLFTAPGIQMLLLSRGVSGFGTGGAMNCSFLLMLEYCTPPRRTLSKVAIASLGWVPGILFVALVAYELDGDAAWQHLALALTPGLPVVLGAYFLCVESPRFLLQSRGADEALECLRLVARTNGQILPADLALAESAHAQTSEPRRTLRDAA